MQLAVSYDDRGNITTLFDPDSLRSDKGTIRYVPAPGERHHVLDLPKELEKTPFAELPDRLHVDLTNGHPKFEPIKS